VNIAIAVATLLALGVRAYQLAGPGYLLGVTEYDDGSYFGSAVHLVNGAMPYRDFVFVQPPGITLLMTPIALVVKATGSTVWGLAVGRILTTMASAAGVLVIGLLVRHRGLPATILACGLLAIYPDSVTTARTVLLEPWLVLFCLLGALAIFDRDRITDSRRRLVLGGLAVGFAGAIEAWAIMPAIVILALLLPRLKRTVTWLAGVAVGFLVPVVPFAVADPASFFRDLVVAQVGPRVRFVRVGIWYRLKEMFGFSNVPFGHTSLVLGALIILGFAIVVLACAWLITRRPPAPLEWFAVGSAVLIVVSFLYPAQFYFHFVAFLAPFLAMAVALPLSRLVDAAQPMADRAGAGNLLRWSAAGLAAIVVVLFAFSEIGAVYRQQHNPNFIATAADRAYMISAIDRVTRRGDCVLTDQVSYTVAADRFVSDVPGCSLEDDGIGADLALSHGRTPSSGAGNVPAVAAMWSDAFRHAQFVLLTGRSYKRVAWTPALLEYFHHHFRLVTSDPERDDLYVRTVPGPS
jgi:Glycosyltransferase family 87